jgi:hypothetical protein
MAREDLLLAPESLEQMVAGLADLGPALGPAAAPGLARVRSKLEAAIAAQRDGNRALAVGHITAAMRDLAELAVLLDPAEAAAMTAMARQFEGALRGGDEPTAAQSIERMRERSGAVKKRGNSDI